MNILTIKTDQPEAELCLFDNTDLINRLAWQAHRQLAETIHGQLEALLADTGLKNIEGIVFFKGPGSFTGLRIGASVANALSAALQIPIVGQTGDDWAQTGIGRLVRGINEKVAKPEYGAEARTTLQKK